MFHKFSLACFLNPGFLRLVYSDCISIIIYLTSIFNPQTCVPMTDIFDKVCLLILVRVYISLPLTLVTAVDCRQSPGSTQVTNNNCRNKLYRRRACTVAWQVITSTKYWPSTPIVGTPLNIN